MLAEGDVASATRLRGSADATGHRLTHVNLARRQVNIVPTESEKFPHAQSATKSDQDDSTPVADANGKGCAWEVRRQSLACFDELIGLGEVQKVRDEILKPV